MEMDESFAMVGFPYLTLQYYDAKMFCEGLVRDSGLPTIEQAGYVCPSKT